MWTCIDVHNSTDKNHKQCRVTVWGWAGKDKHWAATLFHNSLLIILILQPFPLFQAVSMVSEPLNTIKMINYLGCLNEENAEVAKVSTSVKKLTAKVACTVLTFALYVYIL